MPKLERHFNGELFPRRLRFGVVAQRLGGFRIIARAQPGETWRTVVIKRILIGVVIVFFVAMLGVLALAWRRAIEPIDPSSARNFPETLIAQGEVLAAAGNCASCHTTQGGQRFTGGLGLSTSFGTVYSANITPDPETGIGRWSEEAFARALREGVARDGSHLYPAFPFDHFTKINDDDMQALYAYLMTREPLKVAAQRNTVPFPLNIRALQAGWKLLFFHEGVYQPDTAKSADWNRGAYLAEGLGHCASCHTPRNALGASKSGEDEYAGAMIGGWFAPALTSANTAPLPWTQDELYLYLRTGATALHGVAAGSMSEVVHEGLAKLPDADVRAIAIYFSDMNQSASLVARTDETVAKAMQTSARGARQAADAGAAVYLAACAACHYNSGAMPLMVRPELALNSALTAADPTNLIQVVLHGVSTKDGIPGVLMPGFAHALSDADIANLSAYLRRTRTDQPAWKNLDATIAAIRKESDAS
jgi:mono/diheme cytochrome c family protein